jgi:large subunit ribosomal protein L18
VKKQKVIQVRRIRRTYRVRSTIHGTAERPRLSVFRSHKHLSCQLIDDESGKTLASASTRDKSLKSEVKYGGNKAAAAIVGKTIAEKALAAGIKQACFDRGPNKFHGRVAAAAQAARDAGLDF